MSDKVKLKRYDGLDFVEFYPLTTYDQIIASGNPSSTTFLRGDGFWQTAVTSVGLSLPNIFTTSGSPVTTSGSFSVSLANQSANTVFAGPSTGLPGVPSFRALVADDLPAHTHSATAITSGTLGIARGGTGAGDASTARTNLGLTIGADVQSFSANTVIGTTFPGAYKSPGGGTNTGVLLYGNFYGWHTLDIGSTGQVLTVTSGVPVWETPATSGSTYSSASLYIKRIWKKGATESNWTTVFNATTGAGTLISTSGTYTQINLGYSGTSTDMYMIEFSNSSDDRIGKGVAHVGSGTFQSTAGMAVISYDAYETVDGSGQLKIAKYFAQVQRQQVGSSAALGFRYASKVVV